MPCQPPRSATIPETELDLGEPAWQQCNMSIRSFRRKDAELLSQQSGYWSDAGYSASVYGAQTDDDAKGRLGLNLLYSPQDPLIDFVFVHGLGGGSRKTWSKTPSISHYWPQEWLPNDPAFKDVRVHSFGYESDWLKEKNNYFNIHHFAKLLLGELSTSPYLGNADTNIVFIAHSMGGLVIKQAYLLARQDAFYSTLMKRFRAMYFFATPHLGSDLAKLLERILGITNSSLAYVSELKRGSQALQSINEEFRKHASGLDLCSFYEMQKLKVGPLSTRIVDPDSAILGFGEEQQIPLLADHRSICKFDTPRDPNYILARNTLASAVQKISESALKSKNDLLRNQIRDLEKYLGVSRDHEDDLMLVEDARINGTCEWLSSKRSYTQWKDFEVDTANILWVKGKPATGKSVLSGYVINELRKASSNCNFYFFKYSDKSKSRISRCLRSLAFQMACTDAQVLDVLLRMQKDGVTLDDNDERVIWRKLHLAGTFQNIQNHYWVIDALDECSNVASFFSTVLAKLDKSIPLRILVTSRDTSAIEKNFHELGIGAFRSEVVSTADTLLDIKTFVEAKAKLLVVKDSDERAALVDKIINKSQGSFLWTVLVLRELAGSYTEQEINHVLEDVPHGMESLYHRSLESMSQATRGKKLSKDILTWTTCATRPLKLSELHGALKLETKDNFPWLQESILALCGHLVTVDKLGRVQLLHETVREFLLRGDLESEFAVIKEDAHTQIARSCLIYLTGDEMKPPRTTRRGNAAATRIEFSNYACTEFSYHLSKASPFANDILSLVVKFLKSNILSWIEFVARTRDLNSLIRTARNLKMYLHSCATQRSPLGNEMQIIKGWTTDLVRIGAKFADALVILPSAIYSLILPFCPCDSTVYKTVYPGRKLSVTGLSAPQWDDRLACIEFRQGQTTALCYSDELFAVGLSTGSIVLYHATTCQEYRSMDHGETVKFIRISSKHDLIASCGLKTIHVWDTHSGQLIHTFQSPQKPIDFAFFADVLIVASGKNYLASWDLNDSGTQRPNRPWNDSDVTSAQTSRTPSAISISHGHQMLAVAYSGRPITLWDLQEDTCYGSCGKKLPSGETSTHLVTALVFNPNPGIDRLVASYLDGDLILVDPFQDEVLVSFRADCHTLTASLDGRLLAGAAGSGTIQIYEFDTLTLLYRVQSSDLYIKQLAFSNNSLHFADIRGSQFNIWEPTVLLGDSLTDDISDYTTASIVEGVAADPKIKITALIVHPEKEALICSKDNGSVCLYDVKSGTQHTVLYNHKSIVHNLTWWAQRKVLMSVDISNKIMAWSLKKDPQGQWNAEMLFQARLDCGKAITQVLASDMADKFILSTRETDHLWSIAGNEEKMRAYLDKPGIRRWLQHPQSPLHMICFEGTKAHIYTWSDWKEVMTVDLNLDLIGMQMKNAMFCVSGTRPLILLEMSELDGAANTCNLYLLDSSSFDIRPELLAKTEPDKGDTESQADMVSQLIKGIELEEASEPLLNRELNTLSHHVSHVIGLSAANRVVFLDTHSWVCSFSLSPSDEDSQTLYLRHFFVPYDWFSGVRNIVSSITAQDMIVFARNDDTVIIKRGLEYAQAVTATT